MALPRDSYLQAYFHDVFSSLRRAGRAACGVSRGGSTALDKQGCLCAGDRCRPVGYMWCRLPGLATHTPVSAASTPLPLPHRRVGPPVMFVVEGLNASEASPDVNRTCSVAGCAQDSLLNQVRAGSAGAGGGARTTGGGSREATAGAAGWVAYIASACRQALVACLLHPPPVNPPPLPQIAAASRAPWSSHLATPAASWLDDFLTWLSPETGGAEGPAQRCRLSVGCGQRLGTPACVQVAPARRPPTLHPRLLPLPPPPGCCRQFANGTRCPPPDQPPCAGAPDACAECTACVAPGELPGGRPTLEHFQASKALGACEGGMRGPGGSCRGLDCCKGGNAAPAAAPWMHPGHDRPGAHAPASPPAPRPPAGQAALVPGGAALGGLRQGWGGCLQRRPAGWGGRATKLAVFVLALLCWRTDRLLARPRSAPPLHGPPCFISPFTSLFTMPRSPRPAA